MHSNLYTWTMLVVQQLTNENWAKLRSVVETVLLCDRQKIPFRGHRDFSPNVQKTPNSITDSLGLSKVLRYLEGLGSGLKGECVVTDMPLISHFEGECSWICRFGNVAVNFKSLVVCKP